MESGTKKVSIDKKESLELLDVRIRLGNEINLTRRNSNINLTIGFLTTAIAILLLGVTLTNQENIHSISDFYRFIPRLSLAIFVELFSFFFLKLYKRNLDDIKYLTNEITTFESKTIALNTARDANDVVLLKIPIDEFAKTERNFVLKKGESTVELQKLQIENAGQSDMLEKITKIVSLKNS